MPTIRIAKPQANLLSASVFSFHRGCIEPLQAILSACELGLPSRLNVFADWFGRAHNQLNQRFNNSTSGVEQCTVDIDLLPYLKRCLFYYRRKHTESTQLKIANTIDVELIGKLDESIKSMELCDDEEWFRPTTAIPAPRLADFVTLKHAENLARRFANVLGKELREPPPHGYDDKFGVLFPASAVQPALAYSRDQCELRDVGLALAYFDIDNFKNEFNRYTETVIDRNCLPVILRAIEAHVFSHGSAFHVGGDEFIVLLPNVAKSDAVEFMDRLREKLPMLTFVGVPSKAYISVGLCHVTPDCHLTNADIEQKANDAKHYAKRAGGKNCIVTFRGERYSDSELEVVRPLDRG